MTDPTFRGSGDSSWCLLGDHEHCIYAACRCGCHTPEEDAS